MQLWKESLRIKIDFVTQNKGEVILIEVKAKDGRTKAGTKVLTHKEKYKDVVKSAKYFDVARFKREIAEFVNEKTK